METQSLLRPRWPEVLVGLIGMIIFGIGLAAVTLRLPINPVIIGLIMTSLSGVGGLAGFFMAFGLRIRRWAPFGIQRTALKWLLVGVAGGVVAFIGKSLAVMAYMALSGDNANIQGVYAQGGSGGILSFILATLFLAVITPIGEEFLFRGVVTNALLSYGPIVSVLGGALIFALFHGINIVFPAAFVVGLVAGEIFRRSGSIWPPVVVHVIVNLPTIPAMVLTSAAP